MQNTLMPNNLVKGLNVPVFVLEFVGNIPCLPFLRSRLRRRAHLFLNQLGLSFLLFISFQISVEAADSSAPGLSKHLETIRPFIGKSWKGEFKNSTPEKPVVDIAKWERALNGQAVRILHSINNGQYGGETIIMWNPKKERLEFHYFTTAGFQTHGKITVEGNRLITHEEVTGNQEGITAVKAVTELLPDGKMRVKSQYLRNGDWTDGRDTTYVEAPGAEVIFK